MAKLSPKACLSVFQDTGTKLSINTNMIDEEWNRRMRKSTSLFGIVIDNRGKELMNCYQMFYWDSMFSKVTEDS